MVNGRRDCLKRVGNLPQHFALCGFFHVFVGKAGNLLEAIDNHPQAVAARSLLEECMNAASTPE